MADSVFEAAVQETLREIGAAIAAIETLVDVEKQAEILRDRLVRLLAMARRDPGIEAAADDLHRAASAFIDAQRRGASGNNLARARALHDALRRLEERAISARPNDRARELGLD